MRAALSGATQILAHVPGLTRLGSKPRRVIEGGELADRFTRSLRGFDDACRYPPHRAFLGDVHPRELPARPWTEHPVDAGRDAAFGELFPEEEFFGLLAALDDFELVWLDHDVAEAAATALAAHRLGKNVDLDKIDAAVRSDAASARGALTIARRDGSVAAAMRPDHDSDEALAAGVLLENLSSKVTATLALLDLLERTGIDPASIDYVVSCGEEAIGDRYQRGGGNLAKAVAAAAGLDNASGADVKNFCAAPLPALVMASSLVCAGVFERVAVVAGGSLAKLGMKFQGHLKHGLPILEDVLAGTAAIVERDDGSAPVVRLDCVGRHTVADGGSNQQIMEALVVDPLVRAGLATTDVDDYATELHNPEITEPQGSGDVAARNYKTIAALATRRGDIDRAAIASFAAERGMPGYAPTQGHIASALCYLPHALRRLTSGDARRVQLLAKGSLFLGRMCKLSDGMSVLLERNPQREDR